MNGMNGMLRSAPDIHSQTGSATDASIAEAKIRSRNVGDPGAYKFSANSPITTDPPSFAAARKFADPGLGVDTRAYHSSFGGFAVNSTRSSIRFDLANRRRLRMLHQLSRGLDDFGQSIGVAMPSLHDLAMPRCGNPDSVFIALKITANLRDEVVGRVEKRRFVVFAKQLVMSRRLLREHEAAACGNFKSPHHVIVAIRPPYQVRRYLRAADREAIVAPYCKSPRILTQRSHPLPVHSIQPQLDRGQRANQRLEVRSAMRIAAADEHHIACKPLALLAGRRSFGKMHRRLVAKSHVRDVRASGAPHIAHDLLLRAHIQIVQRNRIHQLA